MIGCAKQHCHQGQTPSQQNRRSLRAPRRSRQISSAFESIPTTAMPLAPSPGQAQQGSEAVRGSSGLVELQLEQDRHQGGCQQPIKPDELENKGSYQANNKQDCEAAKRHGARSCSCIGVEPRQKLIPSLARVTRGLPRDVFACPLVWTRPGFYCATAHSRRASFHCVTVSLANCNAHGRLSLPLRVR